MTDRAAHTTRPGAPAAAVTDGPVVDRANELGMLLDIWHVAAKTSMEMLERSAEPVIASHGNVGRLCDTPRNEGHEHIRASAAFGSVIGECGFSAFMSAEASTAEKVVDHPRTPWLWPAAREDWTKAPKLRVVLAARAFTPPEVAGVLGENLLRVYARVWRD